MSRLALALAALCTLFATAVRAGDQPVVVELFTSQGCSACPPADALLWQLARRDDVIALALHVDYWDYLGWADGFADPLYTERQRAYARAAGKRMVYTPQMIVGGQDHVLGYRPKELARLIRRHAAMPDAMELTVRRDDGGKILITAFGAEYGPMAVHLVTYLPRATVEISKGENAGKRLDYANIVQSWQRVTTWDGNTPLRIEVRAPEGDNPAVILLQEAEAGPIVAASRVD